MLSKKIMEINLENYIMEELWKWVEVDMNDKVVKDLVLLLYEMVLLILGFSLEDFNIFGGCIYWMLKFGLSIDDDGIIDVDVDMFVLEDDVDGEGSKMEEVD